MMNALDRTQMLKFLSEQCTNNPGVFGRDALMRPEPIRSTVSNTYIEPVEYTSPVTSTIPVVQSTGSHPSYVEIVFTVENGASLTADTPPSGIGEHTLPASYNVVYTYPNLIITHPDAVGENAWKLGFSAVVSQYAMYGVSNPDTITDWNTRQSWQSCLLSNSIVGVGTVLPNAISIPLGSFSKLYLTPSGCLNGAIGDGSPYVLGRLYFLSPYFVS